MEIEKTAIADVLIVKPHIFGDARGSFCETWNQRAFQAAGLDHVFVQDNQARSIHPNTLRGMHWQSPPNAQTKLVRVLQGSILDVAVDLRPDSPSYLHHVAVTLNATAGHQLLVPKGFAHGYLTLEPETVVLYKVDEFFTPHADAGVRFDDPDLAIAWPVTIDAMTISQKDTNLPLWRSVKNPFAVPAAASQP